MLTVRLLGRVSVARDGTTVEGFSSGPLLRVLTCLILRAGEAVSRTELAFRLWPESSESQARTNLRKGLHLLRQQLAGAERFVEVEHGTVRWLLDAPAHVDVVAFLEASRRGDDRLAVEQYGGVLLPGVYDDWVLEERTRLHGLACSALARLVEASGDDHAARLAFGQRLLELEPTSEWAHREVIEAHRRRGDRASAVRAYHRCVEVLASELGVEPATETQDLYDRLLGPPADTRPLPVRPAPLVGRVGEWAALEQRWGLIGVEPFQLVLVTGEAGVGKSRLVADFARQIQAEGALVLSARSYETLAAPWAPVATWLRDEQLLAALADGPAELLSEVSRLAPQLRTRADVAVPLPIVDELARFQFYEAVAAAVLYGAAPRLLVLDDLQWCDPTTLSLVAHLLHTRPAAKALIVGMLRPEEVEDDHPVARMRDALGAEGRVASIELERLSPDETVLVADGLAAIPLEPADHARIWRETEGNPLFVVELLKAGLPGTDPSATTPTVRAVIERRLRRLGLDARRVAETAAVMGTDFGYNELVAIVGDHQDQLVSALDELWRRRIVAEVGGRYDFTHDKLRVVALSGVSAARRRQLHGDIADGLIAVHGFDRMSGRVAAHLHAAGRDAEAVDAYRQWARASLERYDLDVAIGALRAAVELVAPLAALSDGATIEQAVLIDLGAALVAREGYGSAEVRDVYERAMALARCRSRAVDPAILRGLGLAAVVSCRFDEADGVGRELIATAGDPIARTEGQYLVGVTSFWRGDLAGSAAALELSLRSYDVDSRAVHQERFAQDPYAVCLIRLALTRFWLGDEASALGLARRAIKWCEHTNHRHTMRYVMAYAGMLAAERGDVDGLDEAVGLGGALWSEAPGFFAPFAPLYGGWRAVLADEPRSADEDIDRALEEWRRSGQMLHLTHGLVLRARTALLIDQPDVARPVLDEAHRRTEATGQRYLLPEILRLGAVTAARRSDPASVGRKLDRAIALARSMGAIGAELSARSTRLDLLGTGTSDVRALLARHGGRLPTPIRDEAQRVLDERS